MSRKRAAHTSVLLAALCASTILTACSSGGRDNASSTDDETTAVEIGPGTPKQAPASSLIDADAQTEPDWVGRIASSAASTASPEQRAATLDLAASLGLRRPGFGNGSTSTTQPGSANNSSAFPNGTYEGTMTMDLAYYNLCVTRDGNLAFAGRRTYTSDVEVYINDPAEDGGVTERSPFNLIIASETGVEGALVVVSATVAADTKSDTTVLFDYWRIREDDGEIEGMLTDRWSGFALNTITTEQPLVMCTPGFPIAVPDQLMEGAAITGAGDGETLELEIIGQSLDRESRFRASIDVERVGG